MPTSQLVVVNDRVYIKDIACRKLNGVSPGPSTLFPDAVGELCPPLGTSPFYGQPVRDLDYVVGHGIDRALPVQHPSVSQRCQRIPRCVVPHPSRRSDLLCTADTNTHQVEDVGVTASQAVTQPDIVKRIYREPLQGGSPFTST